jgi:hypothetical protein
MHPRIYQESLSIFRDSIRLAPVKDRQACQEDAHGLRRSREVTRLCSPELTQAF